MVVNGAARELLSALSVAEDATLPQKAMAAKKRRRVCEQLAGIGRVITPGELEEAVVAEATAMNDVAVAAKAAAPGGAGAAAPPWFTPFAAQLNRVGDQLNRVESELFNRRALEFNRGIDRGSQLRLLKNSANEFPDAALGFQNNIVDTDNLATEQYMGLRDHYSLPVLPRNATQGEKRAQISSFLTTA